MPFRTQYNGACVCRLAKEVQQKTPSCPEKARKMGLKANNMSAPFKQVMYIVFFLDKSILSAMYAYRQNLIVISGAITFSFSRARVKYRYVDIYRVTR